jgi:Spherulation-specific family 4
MKVRYVVAWCALWAAPVFGQAQKTVVPAFFGISTHTDGSKSTDWMRIANVGTAVLAVVADGSFIPSVTDPTQQGLTGSCDPAASDYCGSCTPTPTSPPSCGTSFGRCQAKCQFAINTAAQQMVFGYVDTNFACLSLRNAMPNTVAAVEAAVDQWYATYPGQIQGIFFDDGPWLSTCTNGDQKGQPPLLGEAALRSDYDTLYQYVHTNKGGKVMLNVSQFPSEWVMTDPVADYAITFESSYTTWKNNYIADQNGGQPASWWVNPIYQGNLANVLFSATQNQTTDAVSTSRNATHGSPVLYLYDGTSAGYSGVSCSFEQQVAALQDQPAVPGTTLCSFPSPACVDINDNSDGFNCGVCATGATQPVCPPTAQGATACVNGACAPTCPTATCGGQCVDPIWDDNNCGFCGNACSAHLAPHAATMSCARASCVVDTCEPGYTWCDHFVASTAYCADEQNDSANCGACGTVCASGDTCSNGVCTAPPPHVTSPPPPPPPPPRCTRQPCTVSQ